MAQSLLEKKRERETRSECDIEIFERRSSDRAQEQKSSLASFDASVRRWNPRPRPRLLSLGVPTFVAVSPKEGLKCILNRINFRAKAYTCARECTCTCGMYYGHRATGNGQRATPQSVRAEAQEKTAGEVWVWGWGWGRAGWG